MTVGVAITSYNYGHFVAQAIGSVLGQTYSVDQIVVVDDASFDMTGEVTKKYGLPFVQREQNLGTQKNFHDIMINIVKTDLMLYLGADNWLHPRYVELTLEKINDKTKVVGTDCFIVGEYGKDIAKLKETTSWHADKHGLPIWHYPKGDIFSNNFIHGSALFERKVAIECGGYSNNNHIDYDVWKEIARMGYELDKVEEPLLYYRKHRFNFNQKEIELMKTKN